MEAKYRFMDLSTCELVWTKLLQELNFCEVEQMNLYCDNHAILHLILCFMKESKRVTFKGTMY